MEIEHPLELGGLIEEWMLENEILGTYGFDKLEPSISNLTWNGIICHSDPSKIPPNAKKKTCVDAMERRPCLADEPECTVKVKTGLLKYGNAGFNKRVTLSFRKLPDYIKNYLSMKSLDIDLGSVFTTTDPSPHFVNLKPSQPGAGASGPVWRGCYTGMFSLMANLSGDVKIIEEEGSVHEADLMEIIHYLELLKKMDFVTLTPESFQWEVTGTCKFYLYS